MRTRHAIAAVVALTLAAAPAMALPVWGLDNGTEFEISATNNGGTSYGSIDAALQAGTTAGSGTRTTALFTGTFTGVDESIVLYDLTYQGAAGSSLTWASTASLHAFVGTHDSSFTASISNMNVTTTGTGARGVSWTADGSPVSNTNLTVTGTTINAIGDGIRMWGDGNGGTGPETNFNLTVQNSVVRSSTESGILAQAFEGYSASTSASIAVLNTRVEAYKHGVYLNDDSGAGGTEELRMTVIGSEIVSSNSDDPSTYRGVYATTNTISRPLVVVDSLIAGFGTGILEDRFAGDQVGTPARYLLNNTIIGTDDGTSKGYYMVVGGISSHNWDNEQQAMLVNNIFAGHDVAVAVSGSTTNGFVVRFIGDNNAYFDNDTDRELLAGSSNVTAHFGDANRIEPGYTLADAFVDPSNGTLTARDYHLLATALALLDVGEQFGASALGGFIGFVDANNNGTYEDGTDYVIWMDGSASPTGSTKTFLFDADTSNPTDRIAGAVVDIGAYEYTEPVPEPATLAMMAMGGLAMATGVRRRRR